ncbi:hypothetical protein NKH34_00025 [Mesorhizobium sp. M1148]|nr:MULTISPECIES: hypothetical protein [unclassified Mesorhizobium]WJI54817.1 hypothetical protein NLY33_16275 [Mesorhizobium sp. C432A]WJI77468.1 hypothetical protein NLY37_12525 [Mesorhizobium sp. C395A]
MQLIFDDHAFVVPIDKRLNDGEAATVFGNGDEVVVTQVEDHLLVADGNTSMVLAFSSLRQAVTSVYIANPASSDKETTMP